MSSNDQRVVLVTGGNRGIGLEAVKQLSQRIPSGTILLGSRSISNGDDAVKKLKEAGDGNDYGNIKVISVDITDKQSIQQAVEHVKSTYGKLDVLLHNSGIAKAGSDYYSPEVLDVNVIGAHDVVEAFLPLIPKNGHIVLVSSEVGAWTLDKIAHGSDSKALYQQLDDPARNDFGAVKAYVDDWVQYAKTREPSKYPWPKIEGMEGAYTISKTLVTAWTRHFASTHPEVQVAIVCPGYCATELNDFKGFRSAAQGGDSVIWPIFNDFESGAFYQDGKKLDYAFAMPAHFNPSG